MPTNDHYVIIGNGPAGNHAAATLRGNDPDARITIISDENIPFYYKPKLVQYITGDIEKKELMVSSLDIYKEKNIRLRLGQTVERIDPATQQVFLKHMEDICYTKLIIASGSRGRILPSISSCAPCLKFINAYKEVIEFKEEIRKANDFFILGGDLVGLKFLKMLRSMGKNVTILIYPNAFWPFRLISGMTDSIVTNLSETGAAILVKDDIRQIVKQENGYIVTTDNGIKKQVDMVFSFNGLIPDVDFARGCGLDIDHGILVNEYMQTNVDNIYACGGCAQIYNPDVNSYTTSIGWPNAVVQGEVAAMNLLGDHQVIRSAGRKYFDLEGVKIKTTWWENFEEETAGAIFGEEAAGEIFEEASVGKILKRSNDS